ncbi:MAG TPA: hypothetical protein VN281_20770 [Verrucomicrobiae bacterium]|nr:hypothetical protein [Verrucomicrobiae bacterium]
MAALVVVHPEKLAKRKALIEHCWGTMKWILGGGFLLKGLNKVVAEVSPAHFVYNFKRAMNVLGLRKLLGALSRTPGRSGQRKSKRWLQEFIQAGVQLLRTSWEIIATIATAAVGTIREAD